MKPFFSQKLWKILFQVEDWPWMVDSVAVWQCTEKPEVNYFISGFGRKFLTISLPTFHCLAHNYSGWSHKAVTLLSGWPVVPVQFLLTRQSVCPSICIHISNAQQCSLNQLHSCTFCCFLHSFGDCYGDVLQVLPFWSLKSHSSSLVPIEPGVCVHHQG
jgi:hypothetical protein